MPFLRILRNRHLNIGETGRLTSFELVKMGDFNDRRKTAEKTSRIPPGGGLSGRPSRFPARGGAAETLRKIRRFGKLGSFVKGGRPPISKRRRPFGRRNRRRGSPRPNGFRARNPQGAPSPRYAPSGSCPPNDCHGQRRKPSAGKTKSRGGLKGTGMRDNIDGELPGGVMAAPGILVPLVKVRVLAG